MQLIAVRKCFWSLRNIKYPTENVIREAVKQCHLVVEDVDNPSEVVQMLAVEKSTYSLKLFRVEPTDKVKRRAIMIDKDAIKWIKEPSKDLIELHNTIHTQLSEVKEEIYKMLDGLKQRVDYSLNLEQANQVKNKLKEL